MSLSIRLAALLRHVLERQSIPHTKETDLQLRIGAATEEFRVSGEEDTAHLIGVAFAVALWANSLEIVRRISLNICYCEFN